MSLVDFLVAYADILLAISTFVFTLGLFFLVKSGAGRAVPLSSSVTAGSALILHVIVFVALGFYWTASIVAVRALMWGGTAWQRTRALKNGVAR